jgi:hypothetical protein
MCLKIYLGILPKPLFCSAKNYERRYAKMQQRNKRITLRFTEDEKEFIDKKKAQTDIQGYSDFFIRAVANCNFFTVNTLPLLEVANQISKVGTNINQIAKIANMTNSVNETALRNLVKHIQEIDAIIDDTLGFLIRAKEGEI